MRPKQRSLKVYSYHRQDSHKNKKSQIRSPAYIKKYDSGLPKVKEREITTHNLYNVHVPIKEIEEKKYPDAWAILHSKKRTINSDQESPDHSKQKMKRTLYDIAMKKYVRRQKWEKEAVQFSILEKQEESKGSIVRLKHRLPKTLVDFMKKSKSTLEEYYQQETKNTEEGSPMRPTLAALYKNNLKDMPIQYPETNIHWKTTYYKMLETQSQNKRLKSISKAINSADLKQQKKLEMARIDGY